MFKVGPKTYKFIVAAIVAIGIVVAVQYPEIGKMIQDQGPALAGKVVVVETVSETVPQ